MAHIRRTARILTSQVVLMEEFGLDDFLDAFRAKDHLAAVCVATSRRGTDEHG